MEKTKTLCSFGNDEYGLQTGTVKISDLHEFKGHPFKVEQDIQLFELMRSIEDKGVLFPLIVRSNPYSDGYEIIAGHRRKAACEWAGITEVPVIIRELDDADAVIAMIDSNLQREHIKPSEKAFAYKMKLEAMKSQGKRNDLFPSQVGTKLEMEETPEGKKILRADERLAKEVGESRNQIARYIRLTNLIPKILDMVDEGKIAFTIGVELSYLSEEQQYELHAVMDLEQCTPSLSQANNIRFNLEHEASRKAWENLHSKEVEKDFKSLNAFVIIAINDYYERHLQIKADSYFETREKEDAFAEGMVQMVEQKVLANLPALAGMYQMQQSMLMAGLIGTQNGVGNLYPQPMSVVPTVAAKKEQSEQKEVSEEPEENEFLDYSFWV